VKRRDFLPIAEAEPRHQESAEARQLKRIARAWGWIVGPALIGHTRPLALRRGILLMGCWNNEVIPNLRASLQDIWPQLQTRLKVGLRINLHKVDVVPCDPPEAPAPLPEAQGDPLLRVLEALRARRNRSWTPLRK